MTPPNQYQARYQGISNKKIEQALKRAEAVKGAAQELEAYKAALGARCKLKTLENYLNSLCKIVCDTQQPVSTLTNTDLRAYFKKLEPMSGGTKYARYQALRSFFCDHLKYDRQMNKDLTSKWELLIDNIKRPAMSKRNLSRNDHITAAEIDKLLNGCRNPRDKAFLMVLLETGARLSEILSMEIRDINFNAQPVEIKIKHSKTEEKAGLRPVYIFRGAPLLRAWIDAHPLNTDGKAFLESNTPVWVSVNGAPVPIVPNTANRILELVKERAGMKGRKLYAHLFRHTRATDLKDIYGFDVREIQEWLGHTRMETTSGYLTADKKRMLQKLEGETDTALEEKRQEAISKGQPVPCPCGVRNDPESSFCFRCGRVVNKELIENQASELQEMKAQIAGFSEVFAKLSKVSPDVLREAIAIQTQK